MWIENRHVNASTGNRKTRIMYHVPHEHLITYNPVTELHTDSSDFEDTTSSIITHAKARRKRSTKTLYPRRYNDSMYNNCNSGTQPVTEHSSKETWASVTTSVSHSGLTIGIAVKKGLKKKKYKYVEGGDQVDTSKPKQSVIRHKVIPCLSNIFGRSNVKQMTIIKENPAENVNFDNGSKATRVNREHKIRKFNRRQQCYATQPVYAVEGNIHAKTTPFQHTKIVREPLTTCKAVGNENCGIYSLTSSSDEVETHRYFKKKKGKRHKPEHIVESGIGKEYFERYAGNALNHIQQQCPSKMNPIPPYYTYPTIDQYQFQNSGCSPMTSSLNRSGFELGAACSGFWEYILNKINTKLQGPLKKPEEATTNTSPFKACECDAEQKVLATYDYVCPKCDDASVWCPSVPQTLKKQESGACFRTSCKKTINDNIKCGCLPKKESELLCCHKHSGPTAGLPPCPGSPPASPPRFIPRPPSGIKLGSPPRMRPGLQNGPPPRLFPGQPALPPAPPRLPCPQQQPTVSPRPPDQKYGSPRPPESPPGLPCTSPCASACPPVIPPPTDRPCQLCHDEVTELLSKQYKGEILCIHNPPCVLINGCLNLPDLKEPRATNLYSVTTNSRTKKFGYQDRNTKWWKKQQSAQYCDPHEMQQYQIIKDASCQCLPPTKDMMSGKDGTKNESCQYQITQILKQLMTPNSGIHFHTSPLEVRKQQTSDIDSLESTSETQKHEATDIDFKFLLSPNEIRRQQNASPVSCQYRSSPTEFRKQSSPYNGSHERPPSEVKRRKKKRAKHEKNIQSICSHKPPCEVVRTCCKTRLNPKLQNSCVHVPMCENVPLCLLDLKNQSQNFSSSDCPHKPKCTEVPICTRNYIVLTAKEEAATQVRPKAKMVCRHEPPCIMIPTCLAHVCDSYVPYDAIPDCVHQPMCEMIPACCRKSAKEMVSFRSQYPSQCFIV